MMEKISKVVPSSANYNIDLSKERPMRSGMPNYGLPVSMSAASEKKMLEAESLKRQSLAEKENLAEQDHQSEIIDKVTLSFKKTNENPTQVETKDLTFASENSINQEDTDVDEMERPGLSLYA